MPLGEQAIGPVRSLDYNAAKDNSAYAGGAAERRQATRHFEQCLIR
jgi:hypothetical protein